MYTGQDFKLAQRAYSLSPPAVFLIVQENLMQSAMRPRRLGLELLESREVLSGDVIVTPTSVITEHDEVPRFAIGAQFVAVADGAWSDPMVWNGRTVPTAGAKVQIPAGRDVDYDLQSKVEIDAIEISGRLDFKTNVSTSLWVHEIMVMPTGALTIGTPANPVSNSVNAEIVFASDPDLNGLNSKTGTLVKPGIDPSQYGNGLLVFGVLTMQGAAKTPYAKATQDIVGGSTTINLDRQVSNWGTGDTLVFPETSQTPLFVKDIELQETETAQIAALGTNQVILGSALLNDHLGITQNSFGIQRYPHVANLTRNVVLRSEDPNGVRGHVMAMGDAIVNISQVELRALGRTSAASPVNSTMFNADGSLFQIGKNQIGRYSLHIHHLSNPFTVDGVVINDALKWGIAIHDSNFGTVQNTIVYDTDGAAIVTEEGDEVGNVFKNNLVIKVNGGHQKDDVRAGVEQMADAKGKIFEEIGADGSGFWMRSSAGTFVGNTVYDAVGYGFNFNGYYHIVRATETQQLDLFSGNEVAASKGGYWSAWSQGQTPITNYVPQTVSNFLAWHVDSEGVKTYHEGQLIFQNVTIIGNASVSNINAGSAFNMDPRSSIGFSTGNQTYENFNLVLRQVNVEGMNLGIVTPVNAGTDGMKIFEATLKNYINIAVPRNSQLLDVTLQSIQFHPSNVQRISTYLPPTVADIYVDGVGVLQVGQMAQGVPPGAVAKVGLQSIAKYPVKVDLLADGRLDIVGSDAPERIELSDVNGSLKLVTNGSSTLVARALVTRITYRGQGGNDVFVNSTDLPVIAYGGDGDDQLVGGSAVDQLFGGDGNDSLFGNDGDDLLYGGNGDDFLDGGNGGDRIRGEDGADTIFGGAGDDPLLGGGAGNDVIRGGAGDDVIAGGLGDDDLKGELGSDSISGDEGDDLLNGGEGDDFLYGGIGADVLIGGTGRDKLRGGDGNDVLYYDVFDLIVDGGLGIDKFWYLP